MDSTLISHPILCANKIGVPRGPLTEAARAIKTYRTVNPAGDTGELFLVRSDAQEVALWLDKGQARELVHELDVRFELSSDRNEEVSQ